LTTPRHAGTILAPKMNHHSLPAPWRRIAAVLLTALAAVSAPAPARAELPAGPWPDCGPPPSDGCPSELGENWQLISWTPSGALLSDPAEAEIGSGCAADVAWRRTAGRFDVVIAVLDSGIQWDSWDVRRKPWLNRGELPEPAVGAGPGVRGLWDLDGDGLFTVDDYAQDSRVSAQDGDDAADGHLDASDLIVAFSDGVDDDGNGYVDDVAGWDFHWNDNDPYDDTRFGHGTSEVRLSTAEGGNGGDIGTCPGCSFLPVRIGDAFIADADNIAAGILFAADSGAAVIQGALGALGDNPHVRAAMRYAHSRGVVFVMAAGDETSYHHNFPALNPEALYVHSVRIDDDVTPTTYLNYSNCTNYGPRLDLSAPSDGCASGATGITAGIAGLVVSAGRELDLDPPLSPEEVRQILIATVDDVDVELSRGEDADPKRYPSWPGWELHFGYGRVSAGNAVEAVWAGAIPPVAVLDSPSWYEVFREEGGAVEIRGRAEAPRSSVSSWTLEWAPGADPRDDSFQPLASGSGPVDGTLGSIGPETLRAGGVDPSVPFDRRDPLEDNVSRALAAHKNGFTLRFTVFDAAGRRGVARRHAFLEADPALLPGFPLRIGGSIEASIRAADLDGDGLPELVVAGGDGRVHALDPRTGEELPGWPVETPLLEEVDPASDRNHLNSKGYRTLLGDGGSDEDSGEGSGAPSPDPDDPLDLTIPPPRESIVATPALADLDGDGLDDVVVATMRGHLLAWNGAGALLPGFPLGVDPGNSTFTSPAVKVERGFMGSPCIEDMDGDGDWEIVAPAMDGFVYMWHHDGEPVNGWPVPIASLGPASNPLNRVVSSPSVGDVDGDGRKDVVVGSNEAASSQYALLFAIHGDGLAHEGPAYLPNFPVAVFAGYTDVLPIVGEGMPTSPALADVDGDGRLEIGANAMADPGLVWSADGEIFSNLAAVRTAFGRFHNTREDALLQMMNNGAWADLDLDGVPEWINGAVGFEFANGFVDDGNRHEYDHLVAAWDGLTGAFKDGFPQVIEDLQFFMNPAVGDVSGDGLPEVVTASGGYLVHAWDVEGNEAPGFPRSTGGWVIASPLLADLDADGFLDLAVATRAGNVFAWSTHGAAWGPVPWPSFHHDNRGTGNLHTPLPVVRAPELGPQPGCGCGSQIAGMRGGPSPDSLAWPVVAAFASFVLPVLVRRRPRSRA
jgi:hypothetical protein